MAWISRTVSCAARAAVTAGAALADPAPGDTINVKGNAPAVCSLGAWSWDSGPGVFTGGTSAVVSYSNDQLVDASAMSIAGAGLTESMHAPLVCNTGLTWSISTGKGALRLDSSVTPPGGFSNQWLYHLEAGPQKSSGAWVGSMHASYDSDGTPGGGIDVTLGASLSESIDHFSLTFTPSSQSARMLAGTYSETVTLSISPSL